MNAVFDRLKGDKVLWLVIGVLSIFSLLAVFSSTGTLAHVHSGGNYTIRFILKHLFTLGLGIGIMYFSHLIDYRYYSRIAQILLIIAIPLLAYTLFFGTDINQAKRWITVPGINLTFQTSDLAKLALVMYLARLLSQKQEKIKSFKQAFIPMILPVTVVVLLIAPADLSTAIILFSTCLLLMFIGRINMWYIGGLVGTTAVAGAILVLLLFTLPEDSLPGRMATWKARIESFTSNEAAEVPYQVKQANIAVAKGGLIGVGPGDSVQRNFLPHPYSDFIYAIIIEEYGLLGGATIVFLYLLFLFRCVRIVIKSPKAFGAFLALGLSLSLVIQAMINMGVAVNLLPVTGMTLPLVSMGGSSIWFTSIAIGIILSVSRNVEQSKEQQLVEPEEKMKMAA